MSPLRGHTVLALLFIGLACALSMRAGAIEVYTWTDRDGVVHFSDAPPESGDSQRISVEGAYRPGTSGAYPASEEGEEAGDSETDDPHSIAQQRREEMAEKRKERREEQSEIDRLCGQHRQRLTRMEPARRVFYTNEQGESVRMDDDQRMGMIEESRAFIERYCG